MTELLARRDVSREIPLLLVKDDVMFFWDSSYSTIKRRRSNMLLWKWKDIYAF